MKYLFHLKFSSYSPVALRMQFHHLEHQIVQLEEEKKGHIKCIAQMKQELEEAQRKTEHQEMLEFHQSGMMKAQEAELDRLWAAERDARLTLHCYDNILKHQHEAFEKQVEKTLALVQVRLMNISIKYRACNFSYDKVSFLRA